MATQANIIGGTLSRGSTGWRQVVLYNVTEVATAKAAIDATVPHGTQSGTIPGIYALDFECAPLSEASTNQWRVVVTFRPFEPNSTEDAPADPTPTGGVIQVGSRVQAKSFSKDRTGADITTRHTYNDTDRTGPVVQPAEIEGFIPSTVLTVERTETSSPKAAAKAYVGTVNNAQFDGEAARTWLCTAIEGVSEDNGTTYRVTYEFEFRAETWDGVVIFIDDKTDRPLAGSTVGTEIESYELYERTNFANLNLGL